MSDGGIPVELQSWISLLEGLRAIQYSAFASFTFIVWDVCITLDQEVKYIWSQPATSPLKWLFLFNRYFAVVIQLIFLLDYNGVLLVLGGSTHVCRLWFTLQSLAIQALTSAAEVMLGIRVYALYNRSRTMGIVLAALFGAELLSVVPIYATEIPRMPFSILCSPLPSQPTVSFFAYVVAGWGRTPIIVTLLRDGSWSFILQFAMVLINTTFNTVFGTFRGCEASVYVLVNPFSHALRLSIPRTVGK
ncbi:hypothetical protein OE88DRAFT_1525367 [Heliocybe sulcata]|uniref:DUF6533 domain-containing protein n=1 Tax=Heliocybe sulcata TaxID=5364 RepID=A0A5C3NBM1_9AGAM|nr:hypothetical protein OE88DRAFT_1525367 [Heliocybe sulcata]